MEFISAEFLGNLQYIKRKKGNTIFTPAFILQSTPFLQYTCPPDRVGQTANLINFIPAICEIRAVKVQLFFLRFQRGLQFK